MASAYQLLLVQRDGSNGAWVTVELSKPVSGTKVLGFSSTGTLSLVDGGGGGDVYLSADNAFTGNNTIIDSETPLYFKSATVANQYGEGTLGAGPSLATYDTGLGKQATLSLATNADGINLSASDSTGYTNLIVEAGYVSIYGNGYPGEFRFYEPDSGISGTNFSGFSAPLQSSDIHYIWPDTIGTTGQVLTITTSGDTGTLSWTTPAGGGTVTSVGLSLPSIFSVSGSPVTGSGTLTGALATQSANRIFAGPSSGGAATPTFRALTVSDVPGIDSLLPTQTGNSGKFLTTNGTTAIWGSGAGSVTSVAVSGSTGISVSGSPITTSGTISLSLGAITPTSAAYTGTGGSGFLEIPQQSAAPSTPTGAVRYYVDSNNSPSWRIPAGHILKFDVTGLSGNATLTVPAGGGTLLVATSSLNASNISSGTLAAARLPATAVQTTDTGTVTSAMIADGTIVNADISSSAAIDYSKLSGVTPSLTIGTETATTSGTSVTISGIPSTAKRVLIHFKGVSISGTDNVLLQLGTAGGGIETTGYVSAATTVAGSSGVLSATTGFQINGSVMANAYTINGTLMLNLSNSTNNTWMSSHSLYRGGTDGMFNGGGYKDLSAALSQIKLITSGSNTFDAGSIVVCYQ